MVRKPALQSVLFIPYPQRARSVILLAVDLHLRHQNFAIIGWGCNPQWGLDAGQIARWRAIGVRFIQVDSPR
jgi:hypothetical protein